MNDPSFSKIKNLVRRVSFAQKLFSRIRNFHRQSRKKTSVPGKVLKALSQLPLHLGEDGSGEIPDLQYDLQTFSSPNDTSQCDATLVCGTKKFSVHRSILSAVSPFFASALTKGWSETNSGQMHLPTVSTESINAILTYIYTRKLNNIPRTKNGIMKLIEDVDYLQINDLVKVFSEVLCHRYLNTTSFHDVCQFVENISNEGCLTEVSSFFGANFSAVSKCVDFLYIKPKLFRMILQYLKPEKTSMNHVVMSILKWTEFEREREVFLEGFTHVLETFWCPECLNELINKVSLMHWSPQLLRALADLSTKQLQNFKNYPDAMNRNKLLCFQLERTRGQWMGMGCNESQVTAILDLTKNKWEKHKKLPFRLLRDGMATLSYRNHVYLIGGLSDRGTIYGVSQVIKYCPFMNTVLMTEESLISPIAYAGVGLLQDSIYVVNGRYKEPFVSTVQRYDLVKCTCQMVAPTNYSRCGPAVLPYNDFLYIIGRWYEGVSNIVERYDPSCDQWTIITQLMQTPFRCWAAACGDQLVVRKYLKDSLEDKFHVYDIYADQWSVKECKGGPKKFRDNIALNRKNKPTICAIDGFGRIWQYNISYAEWVLDSEWNMKWVTRYICSV